MFEIHPIGKVESPLASRAAAPRQGDEGDPQARIVLSPGASEAAANIEQGDTLLIFTWLHEADRNIQSVHPRGDTSRPRTGVFSTRSPDRPNPIGLHRVAVIRKERNVLTVSDLEAIDGTPVIDIKPVVGDVNER